MFKQLTFEQAQRDYLRKLHMLNDHHLWMMENEIDVQLGVSEEWSMHQTEMTRIRAEIERISRALGIDTYTIEDQEYDQPAGTGGH